MVMRKRVMRTIFALGTAAIVSVLLAACGGSSGSGVSSDSVADVAGNPITTQAFNHWMYVAPKSQAAQTPGQPVIVPNDPPNFNKCIAQARKEIPQLAKTATKTLRTDCKQLFTSLSSQVMDFLIKAYWYQADAHKLGVKVTDAEVQQFPNGKGFSTFLSQTGQTQQDVLYRFRVSTIVQKLAAKHNTKVTQA